MSVMSFWTVACQPALEWMFIGMRTGNMQPAILASAMLQMTGKILKTWMLMAMLCNSSAAQMIDRIEPVMYIDVALAETRGIHQLSSGGMRRGCGRECLDYLCGGMNQASGTVRERGSGKAEFEGQLTHHEHKSGSWTRTGTVTRMLVLESILPWWRQRGRRLTCLIEARTLRQPRNQVDGRTAKNQC